MEFREKGKLIYEQTEEVLNNEKIHQIEKHELYKYLGFSQISKMDHTTINRDLQQHYKKRPCLHLK